MVIAVCGKPGSGKTLLTTYFLMKKFRKENNFFVRHFKKEHIFNNCYSNYPVKLDSKNYSNRVNLLDFKDFNKWLMDSDIVLDEIQAYFDSTEYKSIPKPIANNFQFHRHFGIHNIYCVSQDLSRIPKVFRVLAQEYYQIHKHFKIPIVGIAFFSYTIWYREEDYGNPHKLTRDQKKNLNYEFKNKFIMFRYKKVYKAYDTKYMKVLVKDKELFPTIQYSDNLLSLDEIYQNFPSVANNNYKFM